MTSLHAQPRERRAIGIVAYRADGIARTVHLGRKLHLTQIAAADGYAGDGSRSVDAAAGNALAYAVDGGRGVVAGLTGSHAAGPMCSQSQRMYGWVR